MIFCVCCKSYVIIPDGLDTRMLRMRALDQMLDVVEPMKSLSIQKLSYPPATSAQNSTLNKAHDSTCKQ